MFSFFSYFIWYACSVYLVHTWSSIIYWDVHLLYYICFIILYVCFFLLLIYFCTFVLFSLLCSFPHISWDFPRYITWARQQKCMRWVGLGRAGLNRELARATRIKFWVVGVRIGVTWSVVCSWDCHDGKRVWPKSVWTRDVAYAKFLYIDHHFWSQKSWCQIEGSKCSMSGFALVEVQGFRKLINFLLAETRKFL